MYRIYVLQSIDDIKLVPSEVVSTIRKGALDVVMARVRLGLTCYLRVDEDGKFKGHGETYSDNTVEGAINACARNNNIDRSRVMVLPLGLGITCNPWI